MDIEKIINNHFKNKRGKPSYFAAANALQVTPQTIYKWRENGIPKKRYARIMKFLECKKNVDNLDANVSTETKNAITTLEIIASAENAENKMQILQIVNHLIFLDSEVTKLTAKLNSVNKLNQILVNNNI